VAYVRTLAQPAYDPKGVLPVATTRQGPEQPIFFSHVIHAGSYQIACQYCHSGARRSNAAGVPSVERCMGCHKIVAAEGNPEVKKLHGYWDRQEPIPWVRIFKVPEHAQFTHKQHVQAGVQCQTCHGRIEAMERVHAETG
jgi:DNA-directed RNA polymerase subunit RPC12/RpoP